MRYSDIRNKYTSKKNNDMDDILSSTSNGKTTRNNELRPSDVRRDIVTKQKVGPSSNKTISTTSTLQTGRNTNNARQVHQKKSSKFDINNKESKSSLESRRSFNAARGSRNTVFASQSAPRKDVATPVIISLLSVTLVSYVLYKLWMRSKQSVVTPIPVSVEPASAESKDVINNLMPDLVYLPGSLEPTRYIKANYESSGLVDNKLLSQNNNSPVGGVEKEKHVSFGEVGLVTRISYDPNFEWRLLPKNQKKARSVNMLPENINTSSYRIQGTAGNNIPTKVSSKLLSENRKDDSSSMPDIRKSHTDNDFSSRHALGSAFEYYEHFSDKPLVDDMMEFKQSIPSTTPDSYMHGTNFYTRNSMMRNAAAGLGGGRINDPSEPVMKRKPKEEHEKVDPYHPDTNPPKNVDPNKKTDEKNNNDDDPKRDQDDGDNKETKQKQETSEKNPNEYTLDDIIKFIKEKSPITPEDMAIKRCDDGNNALYFTGVAPNSDASSGSNHSSPGYCIRKCEYARTQPPDISSPNTPKFNNTKDSNGNYRVNYELKLWINPNSDKKNGYSWYCVALPNSLYDGPGWVTTTSGEYTREVVSMLTLKSAIDPFKDTRPKNIQLDDYSYTVKHTDPLKSSVYFGVSARLCSSKGVAPRDVYGSYAKKTYSPIRNDKNEPQAIGYAKYDYEYPDFQMIGEFCYWVGHDTYKDGDVVNEGHGDFRKIPLTDDCYKYSYETPDVKPDGSPKTYMMSLSPGKLFCYACPDVYVWDETKKSLFAAQTSLVGNMEDGYKCARKCPLEMYDNKSAVGISMCIPVGVPMREYLPRQIISPSK